jgi:tetratricopeptide (TPR) repeat protein
MNNRSASHVTTMNTRLDPDELIHLAVAASDRNDTASAIAFLKQAIDESPGFAKAHYLLGAEHAQLGMFDRAVTDMQTAISHDPDLHSARFQLGMLLLTSRQPEQAAAVWEPLDALGPSHYLVMFRDGLLQLARDDFAACSASLKAGIAANRENAPLNGDMEKILKSLDGRDGSPSQAEPSGDDGGGHLLVNAYAGYKPH